MMESNEPKPAFLHNGRHKASEAFRRRTSQSCKKSVTLTMLINWN